MDSRGRTFFASGSIASIAVGLMHIAAHLSGRPPGAETAHEAMVAFTVTALGLTWSIADAFDVASLSFAALSILLGALDLYVLRALRPAGRSLSGLALLNAAGLGVVAAIAGLWSVAPPFYLYALVAILFLIAALRSRSTA
jgi:hypothetical protein